MIKSDLFDDEKTEYESVEFCLESEKRDIYYSEIVKDIVKNNRTSQRLKCCFFGVVCLVFAIICIVGMVIVFNISRKENISYADIGVAVTGFGGVLSSIIVLPQIIAKHLFPENSEEVRFNFINKVQDYDQRVIDEDAYDYYGIDEK